jgi:transposase
MHVRVSSVTRGKHTYRYAQLVESFRRDSDGKPVHRVIANLGRVTDPTQLDNLKAAFEANRNGERLVAPSAEPTTADNSRLRRPQAILRYLDVAVVVETMRRVGLCDELSRLLPQLGSDVAPERVVTALVAQRCVDPQSKLRATRWLPRTALPEMLGVAPTQFNNTRVHRVLEQLEAIEHELMRALSRRAHEQHGRFATLYLDLTDTWFEGQGPDLAKKGRTKAGHVRRKVGIVLLCSDEGHPLRWEVVEGTSAEGPRMLQVMRSVQQVPWLEQIPIVCDRALGHTAHIQQLLNANVQFLTALLKSEFDSYGVQLPSESLADCPPPTRPSELGECTRQAVRRARQTELTELSEDLFYTDLGLVDVPVNETTADHLPTVCSEALRIGLDLVESVASRKFSTHSAAARAAGLSPQVGGRYASLARLEPELQEQTLMGHVDGYPLTRLLQIVRTTDKSAQYTAFEQLRQETPKPTRHSPTASAHAQRPQAKTAQSKRQQVRVVAYFNPEVFVRQRWLAQQKLDELEAQVTELNQRLSNPQSHLKPKGATQKLNDWLRRHDLVTLFAVGTEQQPTPEGSLTRLTVKRDEAEWQKRRSFDGFSVLVAHPKLKRSAAELTRTYRAKNAVEADFQVIKSVVKLRPVRHRTDAKVRAHVALCMLALYVQRSLAWQLRKENISAEQALEQLEPCRLCRYVTKGSDRDAYVLPQVSAEDRALLRRLGLTRLVEPGELRAALRPRSEFVSTSADGTA